MVPTGVTRRARSDPFGYSLAVTPLNVQLAPGVAPGVARAVPVATRSVTSLAVTPLNVQLAHGVARRARSDPFSHFSRCHLSQHPLVIFCVGVGLRCSISCVGAGGGAQPTVGAVVVAKRQSYWAAFSTSFDRFLKESRTFRG